MLNLSLGWRGYNNMDKKKTDQWLKERDIILDEHFIATLHKYAVNYQKKKLTNLEKVLVLIGINRKTMNYWRNQYTSNQTNKNLKHRVIMNAGSLFGLSYQQTEDLANKAGLSLLYMTGKQMMLDAAEFSTEIFPYDETDATVIHHHSETKMEFIEQLNNLITLSGRKLTDLCYDALISERMIHHMRKGQHLRKETILALLITLEQDLENIQLILKKAGYSLSHSLPNDAIIMWLMKHEVCFLNGVNRLLKINDVLDELELPLLMTRLKS